MGPACVALVVSVLFLALGFFARCRNARKPTSGNPLAGTWEGSLVQMLAKRPPVVGFQRLTLSPGGKFKNELIAFFGAMPLTRPETVTGTYTYEPGDREDRGVLELKTSRPKLASQKGTVRWLSEDEFVYTSEGVAIRYSRAR
jgi:hypothetical protein